MTSLLTGNAVTPSVGSQDELSKAIAMAHARADEVYAQGHRTLIDQIAAEDWKNWDARNENANASDPLGVEITAAEDDDCDDLVAA